jgi:hypothetical protein
LEFGQLVFLPLRFGLSEFVPGFVECRIHQRGYGQFANGGCDGLVLRIDLHI